MNEQDQVLEAVPVETNQEIAVRIPASFNELAAMPAGQGMKIIEARIEILRQIRRASILMTNPEDWLTFKRDDGREIAYLQDCGCERIRDLWGIEITPTSEPTRHGLEDGHFMYIIRGNGVSHSTGKEVKALEGGRGSNERFCQDKRGALLEIAVRKAARANLDGNIVRELTGLNGVPREELEDIWKGSGKKYSNCAQGRGYAAAERRTEQAGFEAEAPRCPKCKKEMRLKKGKTGNFWGCSGYPECRETKSYTPPPEPPQDTQEEPIEDVPLHEYKNILLAKIKNSPALKSEFMKSIGEAQDNETLLTIQTQIDDRLKQKE
jgi:hypothetical protein